MSSTHLSEHSSELMTSKHHHALQHASVNIRDGALIVDVRSKPEFRSCHLANALHINTHPLTSSESQSDINVRMFRKLKAKIADVYPPNVRIFVYCSDGARAFTAKMLLEMLGFVNVTSLNGIDVPPLSAVISGKSKYQGLVVCHCLDQHI